jgi:hypothetical protein
VLATDAAVADGKHHTGRDLLDLLYTIEESLLDRDCRLRVNSARAHGRSSPVR